MIHRTQNREYSLELISMAEHQMKLSLKRSFKITLCLVKYAQYFICDHRIVVSLWVQHTSLLCSVNPSVFQPENINNSIKRHHSVHTYSVCSYICKVFLTSTIRPLLMTQMRSAPCMVLRRWAIIRTVRPVVALSKASWTTRSDSASNALVASSRIKTLGFLIRARAIAIRCFWPPDRVTPRSPEDNFTEEYMKINLLYFRKCIFCWRIYLFIFWFYLTALTNHGVVSIWESCDEIMSIGLFGRSHDLSVCGTGLSKPDILHHRGTEKNRFL